MDAYKDIGTDSHSAIDTRLKPGFFPVGSEIRSNASISRQLVLKMIRNTPVNVAFDNSVSARTGITSAMARIDCNN